METRTEELEIEVKAATAQTMTQGQQISDIQWKLEDAENRQRRNNLRILGIAEDLEGQDTRAYIVSLFKQAFPDLNGWDWEKEIQRAHRFPLMKKKHALTATNRDQSYPRAIIVYFGNFLLRQAVFEKARPNSKVTVEGVSFFSRPDFAHATIERRWRLRQMIAQFQELGAEAYLLSPARLKIRAFLLTSMTQGWHTDKIKLMEVSRHPTSCGIKNLYPLLLNSIQDDLATLVKKWEARVGTKETEVCESMEMARTVLVSAGPQAQHFMVLYNLYYTPVKIASWGKTVGIMCPRCGCPKADLCHMFFQCVKLGSLITGISDILKKILKQSIYLTPQMVLLGVDHSVCNSRDRYFLFIAMSVFRNCIASLWRDVDPPRFNQWFSQLLSMYHLENSLYELKGAAACKRFTRAWAPLSVWLLGPENVPNI
ncbi:hypothetical protein NDU88_002687 [Pleurodeles waltl]|uniref:Reverse transcriptase zinc-binding domain-containing protein n=1 Tax=Pleurodeles waltl TaxID=8319 RepID=A0AAV7KUX6_PLEWA|nr:hypothetical protein NDU88_002687 [Pleurodeles waltl]